MTSHRFHFQIKMTESRMKKNKKFGKHWQVYRLSSGAAHPIARNDQLKQFISLCVSAGLGRATYSVFIILIGEQKGHGKTDKKTIEKKLKVGLERDNIYDFFTILKHCN